MDRRGAEAMTGVGFARLRRLGAALVAAAVLGLGGCGGDDDDAAEPAPATDGATEAAPPTTAPDAQASAPLEFTGGFVQLLEGALDAPEALGGELTGTGGEGASWRFRPPPAAPRPARGPVECGGQMVDGAMVIEATGGEGTLEVEGVGSVALTIRENTVIFAAGGPPPLCDQRRGTWRGMDGAYEGREGTFVVASRQPETAPDATKLTLKER